MDDAADFLALSRDHRHHEALVADGDDLLLQHTFFLVRAQKSFQRIVNRFLLLLNLTPQTGQRYAGMVGNRTVGQDFAGHILKHRAELADRLSFSAQARESLGYRREDGFEVRRTVEERDQV